MQNLPASRRRTVPFPSLFENRLGRLFGPDLWADVEQPFGRGPDIDLVDQNGEMLLTAELPGLKKDDVDISVVDGVFILKGEKKRETDQQSADYRISERSFGTFERSFTLPRSVDAEGIKADFKDGVLTVHFPKREEAKGRQIKIDAK